MLSGMKDEMVMMLFNGFINYLLVSCLFIWSGYCYNLKEPGKLITERVGGYMEQVSRESSRGVHNYNV